MGLRDTTNYSTENDGLLSPELFYATPFTDAQSQKANFNDCSYTGPNKVTKNFGSINHKPSDPLLYNQKADHAQLCKSERGTCVLSSDQLSEEESGLFGKMTNRQQSSLVTIFSIWNTTMGSSLLVMAWGIGKAGLIPGIVIMLVVAGLCLFTAFSILQVSKEHSIANQITEMPELCKQLLGTWAKYLANIFSVVVLLGASAVYWTLMSNFFYNIVIAVYDQVTGVNHSDVIDVTCPSRDINVTSYLKEETNPYWDLYSTVPIYLAVLIFPLMCSRNITFFTKFNSFGTISVMYLLIFVSVKAYKWGININIVESLEVKSSLTALTGTLSLSFFIHNIVLSLVSTNRNQNNNSRDLMIAFILITSTYTFIGAMFYLSFPLDKSCIEDNLLNNFNKWDPMTIVARTLLLFQIVTAYPLITFLLRNNIFKLLAPRKPHSSAKGAEKCTQTGAGQFKMPSILLFNVVLTTVCVLVACYIPKIGTLVRYTGAISGFVYIFTLPSLLKMVSLKKRGKLTFGKRIFLCTLPLLGLANLFAQFFIED